MVGSFLSLSSVPRSTYKSRNAFSLYYKLTMSRDVDIDFLGVFDTVASVGAIFPRALPFSTQNGKTRVFRHALALDEHRAKFRQETWHYSLPEKMFTFIDVIWVLIQLFFPVVAIAEASEQKAQEEFKKALKNRVGMTESTRQTDVKEVIYPIISHCNYV